MQSKVMSLQDMMNFGKPVEVVEAVPATIEQVSDENQKMLEELIRQGEQARKLAEQKSKQEAVKVNKQYGNRASNKERSGKRDLTLSTQLRRVGTEPGSLSDDIRHKDNDFSQHCAKCGKAYIFIEGSTDSRKATTYIRGMAEDVKHKAWAVKIIHHADDLDGVKGVKEISIWENGRKLVEQRKDVTWDQVVKGLEKVHIEHVRSFSCKRREAFK